MSHSGVAEDLGGCSATLHLKFHVGEEKMNGIRFSEIHWGATALMVLIRLAAASIVVAILMFITNPGAVSIYMLVAAPIFLGACAAAALEAGFLDKMGVPVIGIATLLGFFLVIGDPLVWAVAKAKPGILPVQEFGFFNRIILFVTK